MAKILFIDTSNNKKTEVALELEGKRSNLFSESHDSKSESAIPLIDSLLQKNKVSLDEINEVNVKTGAGSFTGIRVGVAIANALGYLQKISINGKKVGELEKPVYNN